MKIERYKELSKRLRTHQDVKRLSKELGLDEELLFIIFTQRVTRDATKRFYVVKNQARKLLRQWKQGTTLKQIARKLRFPPVLLASIIMLESGVGRKTFWRQVRNPDSIRNDKLRREIKEILEGDLVYSPQGLEIQRRRGVEGEKKLADLLDNLKISYLTEKDLRGSYPKTPDFLLHRAIMVDKRNIHWIESKANFGDTVEIRRNMSKQLKPYKKIFGDGIVVYWFGFVEDVDRIEGIKIVDGKTLEQILDKKNLDKLLSATDDEPIFDPPEVPTEADRVEAEELAKKAREERDRPKAQADTSKKKRKRRRGRPRRGRKPRNRRGKRRRRRRKSNKKEK